MENLVDIPIFLAVVEESSFTRAGEKLGLTSSAVSKRISNLEEHLKVKLLKRTTRKVELTESGERYIEYAKQAYKTVQEAENAATENDNMPTGVLRVSAPVTFGHEVLANLLPLFLKKYPHLNIEIELTDVFTKVKIEDFDVILTAAHFFDSSYSATNISIDEARVVASPEFLSKYGTPDTPEELVNFNCLLPSSHLIPNQWVFFKGKDEIKVQVSGNAKINNPLAVRILALEGIGISCLQLDTVYNDIEKGDLVTIFDDYKITPRIFKAIYPQRNYLPLKVKVFIDFLIDE
ncbi:LysR family transcriptional regulator, partial [Gammaproteobacteria bacterium]|nr:LysR family transcriptional regulator [Gammaproteobacteria bacterium]